MAPLLSTSYLGQEKLSEKLSGETTTIKMITETQKYKEAYIAKDKKMTPNVFHRHYNANFSELQGILNIYENMMMTLNW